MFTNKRAVPSMFNVHAIKVLLQSLVTSTILFNQLTCVVQVLGAIHGSTYIGLEAG